jgi:hypothetical protein
MPDLSKRAPITEANIVTEGSLEASSVPNLAADPQNQSNGCHAILIGFALLLLTAALAYGVVQNPVLSEDFGSDPGPALQPVLLLWLLGAGGAILVADGLFRLWREPDWPRFSFAGFREMAVPVAMILSLLVAAWLIKRTGFIVVLSVFSIGWGATLALQDLGRKQPRQVILLALGAGLIAAGIYLVFKKLIGVPLD